MEPSDRKQIVNVVSLEQIPCPACGESDQWDEISAEAPDDEHPRLRVRCDCGGGEVIIVAE